MSRDQRSLANYIGDIVQAGQDIQEFTANMTQTAFLNNKMVQLAVVKSFEVIGEASHQLEKHHPDFAKQFPELPLQKAYDMRNQLAQGYFKTDYEIVWQTVADDLPSFLAKVKSVQANKLFQVNDTQTAETMIEQAKSLLKTTGTSQEFQDEVIKQMKDRLESTHDLKENTPNSNERER
jgi:uncharacterized protein with HEPN domain